MLAQLSLAIELGGADDGISELLAELGETQQRFEALGGYGFGAKTEATMEPRPSIWLT